MTDRFTIELQDADLLARLNGAIRQLGNTRELLYGVGAALESNIALRLDETKADPSGKAWAPIKQSTIAIYGSAWFKKINPEFASGIPGSLLVRTALGMRRGLASNLVGANTVEVGFDKAYAAYHEFGTKKMVRRGLLFANPDTGELGADDRQDVLDVVNRFLGDLL